MDNRYAIGLILTAALVALTLVAALRAKMAAQSEAVDPNRRALVRLGAVLGIGFAGLVVRLTSITVLNASGTADRVGQAPDGETLSNPRRIALQIDARRGRILDRNGEVLARSDRQVQRGPPGPRFAQRSQYQRVQAHVFPSYGPGIGRDIRLTPEIRRRTGR